MLRALRGMAFAECCDEDDGKLESGAMTFFGYLIFGMVLAALFYVLGFRSTANRIVGVGVVGMHLLVPFVQSSLAAGNEADAHLYYFDHLGLFSQAMTPGTSFVVYITQILKINFNASFEDMLIFNSMVSMCAVLFLISNTLEKNEYTPSRQVILSILFLLPGLHFWTSNIGKDSFALAGLALFLFGAADFKKRIWQAIAGLILVALVRPHIAVILAAAVALAQLEFSFRPNRIFTLALFSGAGLTVAYFTFQTFFGINVLDINELGKFFTERDAMFSSMTTADVTYYTNPFRRIAQFLFQPLFFDASDGFGLAASVENALLICAMVTITADIFRRQSLGRPEGKLYFFFIITMILVLGLTSYNVGLALRQKVMLYPAFILILALHRNVERKSVLLPSYARPVTTP